MPGSKSMAHASENEAMNRGTRLTNSHHCKSRKNMTQVFITVKLSINVFRNIVIHST